MKKSAILLALLLTGCTPSHSKTETVEVVQLSYTASQTSTGFGPVLGGKGGVSITTSTSPEEYDVIVDCPVHGRIIVDSKWLFNHVKAGQLVQLEYNEYWFGNRHEVK